MRRALLAAALAAATASPACAASFLDEIRAGVLHHDTGIFGGTTEEGVDLDLELRFVSPTFLAPIWAPRPHLGVHVNTAGDTNQLYFGLTWSFMLWRTTQTDGLFLDFSLGGAVHDGELDTDRADKKSLGSRILFRESLELGYRFAEVHSLSVMLDHVSNANLAERNEGLDTLGVRYGLKF